MWQLTKIGLFLSFGLPVVLLVIIVGIASICFVLWIMYMSTKGAKKEVVQIKKDTIQFMDDIFSLSWWAKKMEVLVNNGTFKLVLIILIMFLVLFAGSMFLSQVTNH
ncbi:hypothetical protein KBA63_04965 [Candidatus Woesebacteria bacterium]|nr:hypothetical protein [Candidatus Woesebacteria bacterium]